jgi:hypothetical protein
MAYEKFPSSMMSVSSCSLAAATPSIEAFLQLFGPLRVTVPSGTNPQNRLSVRLTTALTAVYLFSSEARMGRCCSSQILLNVAYCLLIFCVVDFRPLVIGGFFKLVASLALAWLLAFVVVHSGNIRRLLIACLDALPVCFFPFAVNRRWAERSQTTIVVPNEPSLSPLFQRPPPILSL